MPVFALFFVYMLACLALAAALVPALQPSLFEPIGLEPESSLYRFGMLLAIIGMPFFLRLLALNSWRAAGFSLPKRAAWQALGRGLLIGIAIMALLTSTQWLVDIRHFAPPADKWSVFDFARTLIAGLLSGLAVGLIEETWFRGLMHSGMRRSLGFWPTAVLTSALYAALHFMKPQALGDAEFNTLNAAHMITAGMSRVGDVAAIGDSFVTLVLVGIFLSMVRERSGNILWAIGIHAGWVMIIKLTKYLTDATIVDGKTSLWVGGYDSLTGWMASLWIGLIAAVYWYRTRPAADDADSAAREKD